MKKPEPRLFHHFKGLLLLTFTSLLLFPACTPEGVINKTKYKGQKITNTCDQFKEEVSQIVNSNSNKTDLAVAEYDNSEFEGYNLDPGQYEIKDGVLNFRLANDLEYDKYLHKNVAIHVEAAYTALDHLTSMEKSASGEIGMLKIDRAYFDSHKEPYFLYQIPIVATDEANLNGKQINLRFKVAKYKKNGDLKKYFCDTETTPLGPLEPGCCSYSSWEKPNPESVIQMPEIDIKDEKYRYRGFTGTLDLIFPENSTKFDKKLLSEAIQDYIKKYESVGYDVTRISLEGYSSLGGKEEYNQQLSDKRAKAVYEDLVTAMNDSTLQIDYVGKGEDWNRFSLLTKASALTNEEQSQVLDISNQGISNDEKEAMMRKLPFWEKLIDEVIVNTRHTFVTFQFDYVPSKMYVEYYPSQMPVISDELYNVATKEMIITKYKSGENPGKGLKVLDILIGNNKKPNLYAMRSTYQFGRKDIRKAIDDIEMALSLDKTNSQYALAALAYKTKYASTFSLTDRMAMLDQYNDYVKQFPDNRGLFFNRAVMMDNVGYISGAMKEYSELLEGAEATAAQLNNRGVAKLKTMRITEAEADFLSAVSKDANLAEGYFNLALVYAYKGLTDKTVNNLDKAIMKNPDLKDRIMANPAFSVMKDTPKFRKYK